RELGAQCRAAHRRGRAPAEPRDLGRSPRHRRRGRQPRRPCRSPAGRRHRRARQEARRRSPRAVPHARPAQARRARPRPHPPARERRTRRVPRDGTVAGAVIAEKPPLARRGTVLVVDDEEGVRASVRVILEETCDVLEAQNGAEALDVLRTHEIDLVMLDQRMPGEPGIDILPRVKALDPTTVVVLVTAVREVRTAVEALKRGAYDYVTKPFDVDDILLLAQRALEKRALEREVLCLRSALAGNTPEPGSGPGFDGLVGRHPEMVKIYQLITQIADTPTAVLIMGESGTGKELVARAIHNRIERLGGLRPVPIDVRVVAATNVNLKSAVRAREFREDLYYRLNVVPIQVPPLRERREDIPLLVEHFVRKTARECHRDVRGVSAGALEVLTRYDWPGNVRELENVMHRAVVLAQSHVIQLQDVPLDVALPDTGPRLAED